MKPSDQLSYKLTHWNPKLQWVFGLTVLHSLLDFLFLTLLYSATHPLHRLNPASSSFFLPIHSSSKARLCWISASSYYAHSYKRQERPETHKRVKTEEVREEGNRMSLWFKYNSMKLPWNSFYRHTSISNSSSFFHIGRGMKDIFINLLLDSHHSFLILCFINASLNLGKIFFFLFMTGFSANKLLARFLKEMLKLTPTHRHTRCDCAPRPRTLQGGSAKPLIIDFPSYFFCLLQWIS